MRCQANHRPRRLHGRLAVASFAAAHSIVYAPEVKRLYRDQGRFLEDRLEAQGRLAELVPVLGLGLCDFGGKTNVDDAPDGEDEQEEGEVVRAAILVGRVRQVLAVYGGQHLVHKLGPRDAAEQPRGVLEEGLRDRGGHFPCGQVLADQTEDLVGWTDGSKRKGVGEAGYAGGERRALGATACRVGMIAAAGRICGIVLVDLMRYKPTSV